MKFVNITLTWKEIISKYWYIKRSTLHLYSLEKTRDFNQGTVIVWIDSQKLLNKKNCKENILQILYNAVAWPFINDKSIQYRFSAMSVL